MQSKETQEKAGISALRERIETTDKKGLAILVTAFLLAGACATALYWYLNNVPQTKVAEPLKTSPVVVAAKDLTYGTKLAKEHLKVVDYPLESLPKGFYAEIDSVQDQSTKVFLMEGEPVLASKLSMIGGGLSLRIPDEMRAISLSVNEITGVNGFILPGDRVDVLVTVDNAKGSNVAVTKTILQNVEVLASGSRTETKRNHQITVQTVTLLVEPKGAEDLALGLYQGQVQLVLRNPADMLVAERRSTDTKAVLDLYAKRTSSYRRSSPTKEPPPEPTYTIIRNGNISTQKSTE
jgi:pilus assembly protein CpaB